MGLNITGEIDAQKLIDRVLNFLVGTTPKLLITSGLGLLSFGVLDVLVYFAELGFSAEKAKPPGGFGWLQGIGLTLMFFGFGIKIWEYYYNKKRVKAKAQLDFLENFKQLSHPNFQAKCKEIFGLFNPHVNVAHKVLSHPTNQGLAFDTFRICHRHIRNDNPWLNYSSSYFKIRYNLLFGFWALFIPTLILSILFLLGMEIYHPGITKSGKDALYAYIVLLIASIMAGISLYHDSRKMGHAISLVEKLRPEESIL